MRLNETPFLVARLDHSSVLLNEPDLANEVGRVLTRPWFARLGRVRGRRPNRITKSLPVSAEEIAGHLGHPANDACTLDSAPNGWARASAVVENGVGLTRRPIAYVVLPIVRRQLEDVVQGICDLARLLGAEAGFVALDRSFERGEEVALGAMRRTRGREWLSMQRYRERQLREHGRDRITTEIAGVEWGTFLGAGHLGAVNLGDVRRSGAFARVKRLGPRLAYLQITNDPLDDLTEAFEKKLVAARHVLAPILMGQAVVSSPPPCGSGDGTPGTPPDHR